MELGKVERAGIGNRECEPQNQGALKLEGIWKRPSGFAFLCQTLKTLC